MLPASPRLAAGEKRARPELADVFRQYGESYQRTHRVLASQQKVMRAISVCRTQELGGHLDRCDACGFERPAYNSCRNRHCPKCQSLAKAKWLEKQTSELLPVGYFHLVFTLPHEFNRLILAHKKILLALLFKAVSETLLEFGQTRLKGTLGIIPGIKRSKIIFISIVWFPPAPCPSITATGLRRAKTFCFRSKL
jgi:predicted Zn-ribbon and HTH transcriptional regulator